MSGGKRRSAEAKGYRAPGSAEPPKRGILDSLFAPRAGGPSPMPTLRSSLSQGFVAVISTPAIVGFVCGVVLVEWAVLVAIGFQGPFTFLSGSFAWPGPGTWLDGQLAALVFGSSRWSLLSVFAFLLVRAVVLAVLTTMIVERLRTGAVSAWSLRRSLRVLPTTVTVNMVGLGLLLIAVIGSQFLGQAGGIGFLVFVAGMVAAVWLSAAAPAIAADEERTLTGTMQRSVRVARMPGSGTLTLAAIYTILAFLVLSAYALGGDIGVNPTVASWAITIGVNLLHVTVAAMFAYRYLAAAPFIPEAPAPQRRSAGRGR